MTQNWIDVAAADSVPDDDVRAAAADGKELALYSVDGTIYATDNICTHGFARLSDGFLDGFEIECPLHQGCFDVRSGKATCAPASQDIATYPVKIENGRVFVDLGA
ncbi:MAG: Rieske (2Fe-2S) region [Noviherbaspirillum sp.]|jgi:naphthalene 1,2-dioxygenase system ferredoxin subunit|nr:Rieske (2Fe-2S) region [Noviherbaspirillum sp.]MDB5795403.1 Rieske (2Fe-2S) region [Noviherbaspirillum sp.]